MMPFRQLRAHLGQALVLLLLALHAPHGVAAGDRYFAMILGSQNGVALPSSTHTFAVFARVTAEPSVAIANVHSLSWMPADLSFTIWGGAEPGVNLTYQQSLAWAAQRGSSTVMWGPYEVNRDLYDRSVQQYHRLMHAQATGSILYKSMDSSTRMGLWNGSPGSAINCIHAVTDIVGYVQTGSQRGFTAAASVAQLFQPWIIDMQPPEQSWLRQQLRL